MQNIEIITKAMLKVFPAHEAYVTKRIDNIEKGTLVFVDQLAGDILKIVNSDSNIEKYCEDYKWLAGAILEEELHFRRNNAYRLSSFDQAYEEIYSNSEYMSTYMNGLLMSQLFWKNHTDVLQFLCDNYIPMLNETSKHLEIGPGHGLLLFQVAEKSACTSISAWDVSQTSIMQTKNALKAMGCQKAIDVSATNMFKTQGNRYDSIVFSEVLEHLENPQDALKTLYELLNPGGYLFLNAPVNSPAPDHIYLFKTPEEISEMTKEVGFNIEDALYATSSGVSLERARKSKQVISTVIIGKKPFY